VTHGRRAEQDAAVTDPAPQWPVLVVGAGPVGLVAALSLARQGVGVLLVEKRAALAGLSRALVISTRGMEILRGWGLAEAVRAGAADVEPCGWVTPTLTSGEGTEIPLGYPSAARAAAVSPTRPAWAPQDHLEPVLAGALAGFPDAHVRYHAELVGLTEDDEGVTATLADPRSGNTERLRARYVIGADGAHSAVRTLLGIDMTGRDGLGEYHRVQFEAPLTARLGDRRYGLNVITHPNAASVIAPRGTGDRWSFNREWQPGRPRLVDADPAAVAELIETATGVPGLAHRVEQRSAFTFAAQLAERYRAGRCFLAGDAAHRMTPRGGTGMNTGLQDAYDLGWKLGWVLRGRAGSALLDSYEAERRPVGQHNVARSADPGGAQETPEQALVHDLAGRVAHHPLAGGSTLDLLGDELTLLVADAADGWVPAVDRLGIRAPVGCHAIGGEAAAAVGVPGGGALLLRPDGRPVTRWTDRDTPSVAELAALGIR
jgi:2-polyprenyl-6-methoxyphenol hydroxylase-like FAD-dependent oxidoreductase